VAKVEHGQPKDIKITAGIITISDRSSRGERPDTSGPVIREILETINAEIKEYRIIPDEKDIITDTMKELSDIVHVDLIISTGGTGLAPRDVTPEATLEIIDKRVPGIEEAMRAESIKITPHGLLSRAVSGIRNKTLIINLPGSPKAVKENLSVILSALPHAVEIMRG
jgi:molybdenum cofactor synthesis domain-containing protein